MCNSLPIFNIIHHTMDGADVIIRYITKDPFIDVYDYFTPRCTAKDPCGNVCNYSAQRGAPQGIRELKCM